MDPNQTQTQEKILLSGLSDYELPFEVTKTINKALKLSSERQAKKMLLVNDVPPRSTEKFLRKLLKAIPVRKAENKPYMEISGFEFSLLKSKEKEHINKGRFNVFDINTDPELIKCYHILRAKNVANYVVPTGAIEYCLNYIAYVLVGDLIKRKNLSPETTTIIVPLRGALAFLDAWIAFGFTKFVYVDVSRMGKGHKLKAIINYISSLMIDFRDDIIISDPLFATGTTMLALLKWLFKLGCNKSRTHLLSMLTAPDGVGLILSMFDGIEISTGFNDEGVTDDAYVYPGVGDLGRIFVPTVTPKRIDRWVSVGAMTIADANHTVKILDRD